MRFDELNDDNYMMFAIKHYENPQAVTQEDFYEDLKKFKYKEASEEISEVW